MWIAVGAERIDLSQAMELLHEHSDVKRLAIVGGGHICGSFLEAGLINEVSIMVAKVFKTLINAFLIVSMTNMGWRFEK